MNPSIPAAMHAIQLDQPRGTLTLREVPVPRPQAGQVLVRMAAAPINPSDLGALSGFSYRGKRQFPFTPGLEGSGTVVAAGSGLMPRLLNGRRVACSANLNADGTWAEYMLTSASLCVPLTRSVSLEHGAMLLVNPLTALAFFEIARQGKHRALVSTAAASSLGGMLLRLGKTYNLPVIHVVRRPGQVQAVRRLGGDYVLDSSAADFVEQLRSLAERLQATLLLDAISGDMTGQLAEAAPFGSTLLLYSHLAQATATIDAHTALVNDLHFHGWFLANWLAKKNLLQLLQLALRAQALLATDLQSPVQQCLPLAEAQKGLEIYLHGMSRGKILLVADPQAVPL